jgi:hypothetical protein
MQEESTDTPPKNSGGLRWPQVILLTFVMMVVSIGATVWIVKTYIFPSEFTPVTLSSKEQRVLDNKLERLNIAPQASSAQLPPGERLEPEAYSEKGSKREISLSEKELNALLANNTDLARKLAIDLSDNLISAKLLVPLDQDFPFMGGRILKVKAGVEMSYRQQKPLVILKGISIMGVPLPNAWMGGIKNIDLVSEFGDQQGFWQAFADGVEDIVVENGRLKIKLKE